MGFPPIFSFPSYQNDVTRCAYIVSLAGTAGATGAGTPIMYR
jgi:hypothetical protein